MRPHLFQYATGVAIVEVVHPPAKAGVHTSDNVLNGYRCAFPCGQLRYTVFDFRKRFRCRAYMLIAFARLPTLAHPDFKTQEIEAFLSGINNVGLSLVKREIKTFQYVSYRCQGRIYFLCPCTTPQNRPHSGRCALAVSHQWGQTRLILNIQEVLFNFFELALSI